MDGDREIRLEPALAVRLVLAPSIRIPEPPLYLKAGLVFENGDAEDLDWGGDAFDETREITCLAPGTGRMQVCWIVERRSGNGGASAWALQLEPRQSVEVLEAEGQRFELTVENETLRRAIEDSDF